MQFRQFSAHSRTCFIYTLKISWYCAGVFASNPNIALFLLLDVGMGDPGGSKSCRQWWRRDTSHSGVSLSGSQIGRNQEGALRKVLTCIFSTNRCSHMSTHTDMPAWRRNLAGHKP